MAKMTVRDLAAMWVARPESSKGVLWMCCTPFEDAAITGVMPESRLVGQGGKDFPAILGRRPACPLGQKRHPSTTAWGRYRHSSWARTVHCRQAVGLRLTGYSCRSVAGS